MNGFPARFQASRQTLLLTQNAIQFLGRETVFLPCAADAETNRFFKGGRVLIAAAFWRHGCFYDSSLKFERIDVKKAAKGFAASGRRL